MALQPIDLQTMYSQMDNVARTLNRAQQSALNEAMQQQKIAAENKEKAAAVQRAAENEKALQVNDESKGSPYQQGQSGKKNNSKKDSSALSDDVKPQAMKESWLGQHIDITG